MRIYISTNANVLKKTLLNNKLEPYLVSTQQLNYLWSVENGLLQSEEHKFYRIRIKDVPVIKTMIGAFPAKIDASEYMREEECFQIAPRSYSECISLKRYLLPTTGIEWVFEYINNELHDNYFYSADELNSAKTNEILHFLNL